MVLLRTVILLKAVAIIVLVIELHLVIIPLETVISIIPGCMLPFRPMGDDPAREFQPWLFEVLLFARFGLFPSPDHLFQTANRCFDTGLAQHVETRLRRPKQHG